MYHIKFRYKDQNTHGEWSYQECVMPSVDDCIEHYGLKIDCFDYEILSVTKVGV